MPYNRTAATNMADDVMESDTSWDHLSQHTPSTQDGFWQIDNQPRSTLDVLISQAQDSS